MSTVADRVRGAFLAGATRRWHTNPRLCGTVDRVDGHGARVARLILLLHPAPSLELVRAALIHDDGEGAVGDMPGPAKDANPEFTAMLDQLEQSARARIWGDDCALSADDVRWLKFCDRLDAFMWAQFHGAPMNRDGWPEAAAALVEAANDLGLALVVHQLLVQS